MLEDISLNTREGRWGLCFKHTWIIGTESQHNVSIIWYGNGVLLWWQIVLSVQQTSAIQIQSVFEINFLHVSVRWSTNADYVERVSVQMERMAQIGLLDYVRKYNQNISFICRIGTSCHILLPSSTSTISTIAFNGMSILCVHMQFGPQSAGRLSPLQNCSGFISSYWEMSGAGADKYDISSISEMTWSPVGATVNGRVPYIYILHCDQSAYRGKSANKVA